MCGQNCVRGQVQQQMEGGEGQHLVHAFVRRRFADQEHQIAAEEDGGNPHPPRMGEVQVQGPAGRGQRDVGRQDEGLGHGARFSLSQPHGQRALGPW